MYARLRSSPAFVGCFLLAGMTSVGIFFLQSEHRIRSNQSAAARALKQLSEANCDFRLNDRDGNRVNDFWVGDVASLHSMVVPGSALSPIGLIPLELASADARPMGMSPGKPVPCGGYFFAVLQFHEGDVPGTMAPYGEDTDGTGLRTRNLSAFGFCAYPAEYGVTGRDTLIMDESRTILRFDTGGRPLVRWPLDRALHADYEKID